MPNYAVGPQHEIIAEALEAVEAGRIKRLMVFCPPRHGKSELVSKRFPAWYLGRNPNKQIISASYAKALAAGFGRDVRNIVGSDDFRNLFPDVGLSADSAAKDYWHTNQGGVYVAAGVDSAITGRGAHILNIDDPVKDRAEADSEVIRESTWAWYISTAYTRLMPEGAIVLTLTRWHQDDLAGRLLQAEAEGGDRWHKIVLPAVSDEGEALWPARYPLSELDRIKENIGARDWAALYQQSPRAAEGGIFKTAHIIVIPAAASGRNIVRAWDLAATAQTGTRNPDWTSGVKLQRSKDGRYIVWDVVRFRGGPDEVRNAIRAVASQDGNDVRIGLPQDPGQAGKAQVLELTRMLSGYMVESSPETGDKATRAAPVASQVNVGNFDLVEGPWNRPFLDELSYFPDGEKDDQVDALSRAFSMLSVRPDMNITPEMARGF